MYTKDTKTTELHCTRVRSRPNVHRNRHITLVTSGQQIMYKYTADNHLGHLVPVNTARA